MREVLFFGVHTDIQSTSQPMPSFEPKAFLWSKSGRRRSSASLKLLSAKRAEATAISPPTPASPPLLSRRRTLVDASDMEILDAVPVPVEPSSRRSSESYSVRDADFGY